MMEKGEPTLVPEWLKNAGSSIGGGSISNTDDNAVSRLSRNKSFVNNNGRNFRRSSSSDRTSHLYFGRSSSSNSSGNFRSFSSFSRNQRDRDWEKDTYDYRDHDESAKDAFRYRDPLGNTSVRMFHRDGLRRSQSMISGKHGDMLPKRVVAESNNATGKNVNGGVSRGNPVAVVDRAAFERDFPTLGAEERAVTPEVGRVPSPGLNASIQSLSGTLALIGGEKWTSPLAEVPKLVGSNGAYLSPLQQPASSSSVYGASSSTTSLNMAEAVAQGSIRAQSSTQLSVGTQKLEELVIKQCRQLIPVTPSLQKTVALNASDKQKSKVGPQLQQPLSSSHRGPTVGKLHVLKPARDKNGTPPILKDNLSPTSGPKASAQAQSSDTVSDRKPILTVLEKRPTSQARSRNDFFNLMRKKSMESPSPVSNAGIMADSSSPVLSSTFRDENAEVATVHEDASDAVEVSLRSDVKCSVDGKKCVTDGKKYLSCEPVISEEEEAAFLRSLGWEENDEEGGGLTDEEITSFYRDLTKYINSKPSLKILQGVPVNMLPLDSQVKGTNEIPNPKLES